MPVRPQKRIPAGNHCRRDTSLRIDNIGLDYEVDLPRCRNDVLELVQRGDLRSSANAFRSDTHQTACQRRSKIDPFPTLPRWRSCRRSCVRR